MDCNTLKNLPVTVYYGVVDIKHNKLVDIQFFSYSNYTSLEKINKELTEQHICKEDFFKEIELAKQAKEGDNLTLFHKFYEKDKKHFLYIKAKIKIIKKDEKYIHFVGINEDVSKEKENESIVNAIINSNQVGIAIYKDKILFIDKVVENIFKKDITNISIKEVVPFSSSIKINLKDRLEGKANPIVFTNFEIINFEHERKFIDIFIETIYYQKSFAGLALIIDKTYEVKYDMFESFLLKIGEKRLLLFNKEKYNKQDFFEALIEIFYPYECLLKYDNFIIGENFNENFKEVTIFDNGSELYIPLDKGYFILKSKYKNEFEEKLIKVYERLQKSISYTIDAIEKHHLIKLLTVILEKSHQWVLITDKKNSIVYLNEAAEKLIGYSRNEILGKQPTIFCANCQDIAFHKKIMEKLLKGEIFETILTNKNKNGEVFYLKTRFIPVSLEDETYFVTVGIDVTKEKKLKDYLLIDFLTGLLNREGFIKKAKQLLNNNTVALFIIDIRNFKALNEIKGNSFGNFILKEFADFLRSFFYEEDLIARLSGDEFAVLMRCKEENIYKILLHFIQKVKNLKNLGINVGIAIYPKNGKDIVSLIEKAYIALEYAKKLGENSYKFYSEELKEELKSVIKAKSLIEEALTNDLFEYFFQPYYSLKEKKIVGAEALLRIVKNGKVISPFYFIDYAEKSGIITEIEKVMYKKLPFYMEELNIPISVNFSAVSFRKQTFLEEIFKENYYNLTLELTEREIADNIEYARKTFEFLKKKHFKIAIDDFGTGYSTLSYIKDLDFDIIKIDINFIREMLINTKDYALVKTIIILAKEFNIKTIAEGVEEETQLKALEKLNCDYAQGYLISPPLPLEEMKKFLFSFKPL